MQQRTIAVFLTFLIVGIVGSSQGRADDWPQWLGPERDSVWRESGILERFPEGGPKIRWRKPVGGGYAGPAVAEGRVYVSDRHIAQGAGQPGDPFARGEIPGTERVLCVDAKTGDRIWDYEYEAVYTVSYPAGPRVTPLIHDGLVYSLGAEGHLACLDAASGELRWRQELTKEYAVKTPTWGFAGHPLVYGDKLICLVGGEGSVAVAFDRKSGKELWRNLSAKEPGYAPPTLIEVDGKAQVVIWHPESVNALDPETGALIWTVPWALRAGLSVPTPRQDGDRLFLTSFYNGSLMLKLRGTGQPDVLWKSRKASEKDTEMLHSIMSTPFIEPPYIYGVCSYGQFRCLNIENGERVWKTMDFTTADGRETRWANAFIVRNQDRYFLFNELGDLIIARLSGEGPEEIGRARVLEPTGSAAGRKVLWSHPAFADRAMFARNDRELVCVELATGLSLE